MDYPSSSSAARIELVDGSPELEDDKDPQEGASNNFGVVDQNQMREHMFDKVVTPSDVGKLNRLVIPKQHAEKYFPLDSSRDEKGLLLNFEDRTGKAWRFRYSYWNSSQSYVMTKGWSRFVKEKKLDAGDIVSFHRGNNKFFIDWRRRPRPDDGLGLIPPPLLHFSFHRPPPVAGGGWSSRSASLGGAAGAGALTGNFVLRSSHSNSHSHPYDCDPYPYHHPAGAIWDHLRAPNLLPVNAMSIVPSVPQYPHWIRSSSSSTTSASAVNFSPNSAAVHRHISSSSPSSRDHHQGGVVVHREEGGGEPMVFDSVPVVQGKAAGKRLRLFGVNMDCPSRDYHYDHDDQVHRPPPAPHGVALQLASSSLTINHEDLQLRLPVDKGKLSSSSSSSMSLDLDM